MATLRAQASVEDENNTGTVMKKLIVEHKPNIRDEILFQVPDQTEHSSSLSKYGLGPCFTDEFLDFFDKYYPHDIPLPLARSTTDWAPDWENYSKSRPFKIWVTSTSEYNEWLVRVEKAKKNVWKKAGIYNSILMSYDMPPPDTALISALAFFWSPSTNAFHFPCGPMTPTLQDVAFITSFRPHGIEANDALEPPKPLPDNSYCEEFKLLKWEKVPKTSKVKYLPVLEAIWLASKDSVYTTISPDGLEEPAFAKIWLSSKDSACTIISPDGLEEPASAKI